MSENPSIEYHKTRDFSKKINATIEFIKENFKPLFKALLYIAGPPVILGSVLMSQILDHFMTFMTITGQGGDVIDPSQFLELIPPALGAMLFLLIGGTALVAVVHDYMILYEQQGKNITVQEVWERTKKSFWNVLSTMLLYVVVLLLVYAVILIPTILFSLVSPALMVLGIFIAYGGAIYMIITFSLLFVVRAYERVSFLKAIFRCFELIKGKWWSTFGVFFVTSFVQSLISSIFFIPWYVIFIIQMLHETGATEFGEPGIIAQIIGAASLLLYLVTSYLLYCIPLIAIAFQYFNLVERKESRGLMAKIESFGTSSTQHDEEEHY
ncbi:hypothetical protein FNH22_03990 [Fulvivirga sp. M361]|uniref:hypothetical protein n=1 Tax=Fulvivirga sp. M361 TaxID=2594266 RepID=UPI00117A2D00|nr:hypothetical protein [Fulvivirga sp. M361]TRX61225.1 hypothetical protein FNH22_03990 [Fulvivirga sp. M361]